MMLPTFSEIRFKAMREKTRIVETVMMADDSTRKVSFGPRGGWVFVK